jgi:hypothetical protein
MINPGSVGILRVIMAHVYAPIDINPAWPSENWPVKPVIRLRLTARIMLMQIVANVTLKYALIIFVEISSWTMP